MKQYETGIKKGQPAKGRGKGEGEESSVTPITQNNN
jgi:hypothetical protein